MEIEARLTSHLDRGDVRSAATEAIQGYGPQILGYLTALLKDDDDAQEVFSQFAEDLWKGLPGFRRECTLRAWAFKLAWHAASRFARDPYRRRRRFFATSEMSRLARSVATATTVRKMSAREERVARLRATLDPEEQTLLILRLDKKLPWEEVALVLAEQGETVAVPTLRKRFERVKEKLARLARDEGLLE